MSYDLVDAKPIHELCKIIDCEHKTAPYVEESEFLVVRTSNVRNGQLVMEDMKFTTEEGFEEWTQRAIPEYGDVLFTREAPAGESCLVPEDKKICMGQRMVLLRPNRKKVDPLFLSLILATEKCKFDIYRLSIGSTVSRINISDIKNLKVASPPLPEQQKIAKILSTWDQAISATEKLLENSQQQKKALMQQLLTGKKRLLDENEVSFSEEWNEYSLGNLGNTFTGLMGKTKDDFGNGVPYITYMNIFKNSRIDINQVDYVIVKEDENQNSVRYGDIFFTTSSETAEEVGMSSVLLEEVERLYLNSFCFGFRLNNFKILLPQFAAYMLRSSNIRKQISILGQGATRYNLSKNQLMKLILKLPTIAEQKKITEVLTLSDQEIQTLQKKLDCLKQEKKALMQQLLTGKKRVKVVAS